MRKSKIHTKITTSLVDLDLTHKDIAEGIGVSRPMVSMILEGKRRSHRTRKRIAQFLHKYLTNQGEESIRIGHELIDLLTEK